MLFKSKSRPRAQGQTFYPSVTGVGRTASAQSYIGFNAIERQFGRFKSFRCIARRYDKLAAKFLAAVHRAAAVSYWI